MVAKSPSALVAGVDEAGRGPLAGPVVAAAVILDPERPIKGLADSKALTPLRRESLYEQILQYAYAYAIGRAEVWEIDTLNIFQATLLAMQRAVNALAVVPARVLIDGTHCPVLPIPAKAIIKGDVQIPAISAASILAKVTRDQEMVAMDQIYPGYGFVNHKGYGTPEHIAALSQLGPCDIHRRTFKWEKEVID